MIRRVTVAAAGGLAVFHLWLLVGQAWEGHLLEPWLLLRWLLSGVLAVSLARVLRSGSAISWSRRTVALCLLGALVHGPALLDRVGLETQRLPEAAAIVVEIATLSVAIGIAVLLIAAAVRRAPRASRAGESHRYERTPATFWSLGFIQAFAPRPPPVH